MVKVVKYNGDKTFMYPNSTVATPERVQADYPAIMVFPHIIETDENEQVLYAIDNLAAARTRYEIDPGLSEEEAIAEIERIRNTPPVIDETPSAEERQAAALEAIADGQTTENARALNILLGEE